MRIAFVYDRVNTFGGAERILGVLHEIWPEAPLFTSVYDPQGAAWAKDLNVRVSWLQNIPGAKTNHESFGWLMPLAFESLDLSGFDVVISVTSEAAKGVITKAGQLHICYLLTPTRYLWSHDKEYLHEVPRLIRPLASSVQSALRCWDFIAAQRPDYIFAISEQVRKRCRKYYRRESEVIYPPLSFNFKRSGLSAEDRALSEREYFLVVSRLVRYKRIDLAIEACNRLKANLVVVGSGADEPRLKSLSGPMVRFAGNLTDSELVGYYRGAKALLMPQEEDFGLTALEAVSLGIPVVSYKHSGAVEMVREGENGILFGQQTVESLIEAMRRLPNREVSLRHGGAKQAAEKFSVNKFKRMFLKRIEELWVKHQKS